MIKANQDIREEMKNAGICQWQIADKLGICECMFSRKLRHELPDNEKETVRTVIQEIKRGE